MKEVCSKYGYKFKLTKAEDGEYVALGKVGLLYHYGVHYKTETDVIGAMFIPKEPSKGWTARRKKLLEAGALLLQNGDQEGTVIIPSKNGKLVRLAAKLMGVKQKREMSPERKAQMAEQLKAARSRRAGS